MYRKKPVVIEAFKFYVDNMPEWFYDKVCSSDVTLHNCNFGEYPIEEAYCEIKTLEGVMTARGGDFIIRGVKGEIYPCKPDIFEQTYDVVEESTEEPVLPGSDDDYYCVVTAKDGDVVDVYESNQFCAMLIKVNEDVNSVQSRFISAGLSDSDLVGILETRSHQLKHKMLKGED